MLRTPTLALVLSLSATLIAQTPQPEWKGENLQYFPKDISRAKLVQRMREFSLALNVRCQYCHAGGDGVSFEGVSFASDEKPAKVKARAMLRMVDQLNGSILPQLTARATPRVDVDCVTCHHGMALPKSLQTTLYEVVESEGIPADLHAIDYLLKPFSKDRFTAALNRAKAHLSGRERDGRLAALLEQLRHTANAPSRVAVPSGDRIVVVSWSTVDWIEAADNYVKLHVGSAEYLLRHTLAALEKDLDATQFGRIHRSTIVRIDCVAELFPESHGDFTVQLRDGVRLPMSRTFRENVERAIRWTR